MDSQWPTWRLALIRFQSREVKLRDLVRASVDHVPVTFQRPLDIRGMRVVRDQEHVFGRPEITLEADFFGRAVSVRMVEAVEIRGAGRAPPRTRAILAIASVRCGEVLATSGADKWVCATYNGGG